MNTKLVRVDVESLQDEAKKSQSLQILKEAGEIIKYRVSGGCQSTG